MKHSIFYQQIIAEIGSVHDGSFGNAQKLIELAAACGANWVKFQYHIAESETTADAPTPPYFKGEPRMDYFKRTAFSDDQWRALMEHCQAHGVRFLCSPFSIEAVERLERLGVEGYKIPSGEVSNLPLLERVSKTGKCVILSSGMSSWEELDRAVEVLQQNSAPLHLVQCTSEYPCPPQKVGLNILSEMRERYDVEVGYSDHTLGLAAPFAAAAQGALSIEKHFTFSQAMYGSDAKHSMEPQDFKVLCQGLKDIWEMLGSPVDKSSAEDFRSMKDIFEKSLVASHELKCGQKITEADLAFKKPGNGISAANYKDYLGRTIKHDLPADHLLSEGDFES